MGVYAEKIEADKTKKKSGQYFCMANSNCRRTRKVIPCKGGDRSNVNSHLKRTHGLTGMAAIVKEERKQATQASILSCIEASKNSGVGAIRSVVVLKRENWNVVCACAFFSPGTGNFYFEVSFLQFSGGFLDLY